MGKLFEGVELVYPSAVDPETGHLEVIGAGRVAQIGKAGVERVIQLPTARRWRAIRA